MTKKEVIKYEKITDHITYRIIDNTIYLFKSDSEILPDEIQMLYKKLLLLIDDNDISYINISGKNLAKNKEFYQNIGFNMSYYDVNKLNLLYKGYKNKELYKCYGIMTKNDFLNMINSNDSDEKASDVMGVTSSNDGFISNVLLLIIGFCLLCFFSVQGAISLVK